MTQVQSFDHLLSSPERVELPSMPTPPDTSVELPGGYWDISNDVLIKTAEVRELTGNDEEIIARANTPAKFFKAVLERGVIKVGDMAATPQILAGLTVGDVDTLLLHIRFATYGETIELTVTCPSCGEKFDLDLDLKKSVPIKKLDGDSTMFTVDLRNGRKATMRLATLADQSEILDGKERTTAEVNTLLLSRCIGELDGFSVTVYDVRGLGIKDRKTLVDALVERTPGPQLDKVKESCVKCSEEIPLPLSMADLFQLS